MTENSRHLRALEFHKIREKLAEECSFADSRDLALSLEPVSRLESVEGLLQQTQDAHMLMARFGGPTFGGLQNVSNALKRAAAGAALSMRELLEIAEVLRGIRGLSQWRDHCSGVATCLDLYFGALTPNKYLEEKIAAAILSEEEMADNASPGLYDIRRKIRAAQARVREQLDKMLRSTHMQKILQEQIVTLRGGRFVIPVKAECRNEVHGLVHDTSSSGATVFIEPMAVVQANNEIKVLEAKEEAEIERILMELSVEAGGFAEPIIAGYECAVELNLIFAKARLAYTMKATLPQLNAEGLVDLRKARHPLIPQDQVVPIDIQVGERFDTLVITGPNTGGKTVSIKTLGLLTVMAMCGLMLPVSEASRLSVFEEVLVDIGDEQSIEQSLSTFSAHMKNMIGIIEEATPRSLVLLDELGAGTDPVEGAALAMAILEKLHEKGAKVAATTHYAELKSYALQTPRVENGCCEFDVATLRPTYRLLIGVPGRSNAFAISQRLGLEEGVIARARELVSAENARFEDMVESLERSRQQLEQESKEAELHRIEAQKLQQAAEAENRRLREQTEKEMDRAKAEAKRIVERAKMLSTRLLDELESFRKEKSKENIDALLRRARAQIKSETIEMESLSDPVAEEEEAGEYVLPRPLQKGDRVRVEGMPQVMTVMETPGKSPQVQVQAGLLQMRVKIDRIRLATGPDKSALPKTRTLRDSQKPQAELKREVDLRGQTVEEALMTVDSAIDSAMLLGTHEVWIIHGKGTGALRSGVQMHLRKHPCVRSYRLGAYGEGESGVTIVELK